MYDLLLSNLQTPSLYAHSDSNFWNDAHISMQLLKAHLDTDFEGASHKKTFMDEATSWIAGVIPPQMFPCLLDIGCGPGLYAERFANLGYAVTGIDFSSRSIAYAKESAASNKLDISYCYQNYLEMDYSNAFDLATLIYCDYGALSTADRIKLLANAHNALHTNGKLLLDVFSLAKYSSFPEHASWNIVEQQGFWRAEPHMVLSKQCKHTVNVSLEQTTVLTPTKTETYYIWNTYFSPETLIDELQAAGFKNCHVYANVAGYLYTTEEKRLLYYVKNRRDIYPVAIIRKTGVTYCRACRPKNCTKHCLRLPHSPRLLNQAS